MYNVFFENVFIRQYEKLCLQTKLRTFIEKHDGRYYVDVYLSYDDVIRLLLHDIVPYHSGKKFFLRIRITNSTKVFVNNFQIHNFDDDRFKKIPVEKLKLNKASVKKYSKLTSKRDGHCYATDLEFKIAVSHLKGNYYD